MSRAFIFVLILMFIPFAFAAWKLKLETRSIISIFLDTIHFGHVHAPLRAFFDKLIDMA